jgi:hypothetical protein
VVRQQRLLHASLARMSTVWFRNSEHFNDTHAG